MFAFYSPGLEDRQNLPYPSSFLHTWKTVRISRTRPKLGYRSYLAGLDWRAVWHLN